MEYGGVSPYARNSKLAAYQSVSVHGGIANADPHGLVLMLMDAAVERMTTARGCMDRGEIVRTITGDGPIAVATSGLAERGAHILDPHTREPVTELASVTVAATDLITADVYATAAVAMGAEAASAWLRRQPGLLATLIIAGSGSTT